MNKTVKYVLYALGAAIFLFVAAIGVIALTVDPNSFKPMIVEQVKVKKQRTLTLAGDIKLSLFPKIGLDLGKVALSEHKGNAEFAAVEHLKLGVAWLPLLKKELVVEQVIVDGVRANLIRNADGSTNFDDLMKKEEEEEQKLKFDIDGVKVTHAALNFDDRQAKRKLAASDISLTTGRLRNNAHTDIETVLRLDLDKPQLAVQVQLETGLIFDLDKKHHQLDGLKLALKGEAVGIHDLDLSLSGNVDANLDSFDIVVEKLVLALKGSQETRQIDAKLDAPRLQMTKDKVASETIKLDAKLQQPDGIMSVVLSLSELNGNAHAFQAGALSLDFNGKQADNALAGKLASPVSGNLDQMLFSLPKIVANLAINNPKLPNGGFNANLNGDASANVKQEKIGFNGSVRVDDSTIKATFAMQGFGQPHYNFNVDIDQLDADRYLTPKPSDKVEAKAAAAEKPLDLSALKKLNASGSLRVGSLKYSNVKTQNLRIDVKAGNGRVDVAPISANLYQGSLAGALSVNASATPQFSVRQRLTNVSIGPLLKDAANKDILEGRGNVNLDVVTQGDTVGAMKKNLNGSAGLLLNDGAIKGINIAATLRNAKAKLGTLKGTQTQAANQQEKTDFTELKASFSIRNGVAHNDDLTAKSPLLRLGGNGDIDIGNNSMNYVAKATVVGSLEGQGGADTMKGLTVPVRIAGPFDALKYSLDFNALVTEAVKTKVQEGVKSKLEEQLKGGLKGLFGK